MDYKLSILIVLALVCIYSTTQQPAAFKEAMKRYEFLLKELRRTGEFPILQRRYLITGLLSKGQVGYNVNKGYEIFICVDGSDVNSIFHVILHEIAHTSVTEYQHSGHFWDNLHKLKAVAGRIGIYKPIQRKAYCGHHISD
jgi:hypothetical protein